MGKNRSIIIAGTQSGSGKTTVTLGIMAALQKEGYQVGPFKCGPDFIDPSLHQLITGRISRNLDLWMSGEEFTRRTFARHGREYDISVIEGVMGMFDGGNSSSAALARALGVPVILVLDVRSAAQSVAAVLKGFEMLEPDVAPRGVILNNVASERHLELVTTAIEEHCHAEIIGYLPRNLDFDIPSRHLGLHMGDEAPISDGAIEKLAETVDDHIDLQRLYDLAGGVSAGCSEPAAAVPEGKVRIGVARDKAFCFYYEDNLDLLQEAGAELVPFSPLNDETLPEDIDGLYLGGGYPELYADQLSQNEPMLRAVRAWAEAARPVYAECGGFMYLTEGIVDHEKRLRPMAGVFPVKARMQKRRASLGYREVCLEKDCIFGKAGTVLRGHEFHYSSIDEMDEKVERVYTVNNGTLEGYHYKNVLGGYMHLHFGFTPSAAEEFVKFCSNY